MTVELDFDQLVAAGALDEPEGNPALEALETEAQHAFRTDVAYAIAIARAAAMAFETQQKRMLRTRKKEPERFSAN